MITTCPHCRLPLDGAVKPHCRDDKGRTTRVCGWLVHDCGATVDPRRGTHSCKRAKDCREGA